VRGQPDAPRDRIGLTGLNGGTHVLYPPGRQTNVIVRKKDDVPLRGGETGIAGIALPGARLREVAYGAKVRQRGLGDEPLRAFEGAVVYDEHFRGEVRRGVGISEGCQCFSQCVVMVTCTHNDGNDNFLRTGHPTFFPKLLLAARVVQQEFIAERRRGVDGVKAFFPMPVKVRGLYDIMVGVAGSLEGVDGY
jgi:hypothetical protein